MSIPTEPDWRPDVKKKDAEVSTDDGWTARSRLGTVLSRSQLATLPKVQPLVAGVVSWPAAIVLIGAYALGKSVLAHALACCIATGTNWLGHATTRRRVLVVVGEGAYGLDARIGAWEKAWNNSVPVSDDDLTFMIKPGSLRDASTWDELTEYAVTGGYGFVVLDTFSSLAPDADETKDTPVIMRRLSDLSAAIDGSTMLVHHPGWSDAGRARGGYTFEANADEVLILAGLAEGSDMLTLTRKKVKDGPNGAILWLRRRPSHGSVIIEGARHDDASVPLRERIVGVLGGCGDVGASGPQISKEIGIDDKGRSGFYKALAKTVDEQLVTKVKSRYYLTEHAPDGGETAARVSKDGELGICEGCGGEMVILDHGQTRHYGTCDVPKVSA
ncbi:AAA family ATPase [Acrocarpospora sp. B8E8]|uniref:AAA family ATPase n=1 Tax=Acrocarpospora sp. B8E8 TaxID=3153572 RepID=UPI00325ECAE8